ncbi:MAG TPA: CRTAC1 family protein, partial [Thermoanaerobaculia bacterium]|nr:CRTAC1 family protein [Thermoanaerobaculia bacterium]
GKFAEVSDAMNVEDYWPWGLSTGDLNADGFQDVFITASMNFPFRYGINSLLLNDRGKIFRDSEFILGVEPRRGGRTHFKMDSLDCDGEEASNNIFGNSLYHNLGGGKFAEVSDAMNVEDYWPWGLSTGDLNADGFQDVFITASMNFPFRYGINSLLLNDRGKIFRDSEFVLGVEPRRGGRTHALLTEVDCDGEDQQSAVCKDRSGKVKLMSALGSRSSVIFDLDGDGDLDIVTNDFNSEPMVLISNLAQKRPGLRYLKVRLRGTASNRDGLGARVQVKAGGQTLTQWNDGKSGYLSQSSMPLYFGLGDAQKIDAVEVTWPSGKRQTVAGPKVNGEIEIVEK